MIEDLSDSNFNFPEQFCYRATLGHGSFGVVVLAVRKTTLETMAVKVLENIT